MRLLLLACLMALPLLAVAEGAHEDHGPGGTVSEASAAGEAARMRATLAEVGELTPGVPVSLTLTLKDQYGRPLRELDLDTLHTRKVHLFAIDGGLEDYHHLHPAPGAADGEWVVDFVPAKRAYKLWVESEPTGGGLQFVPLQLGGVVPRPDALGKAAQLTATAGGLRFTLTLAMTPQVGEGTLAIVNVYDDQGVPVTSLEPLMGAYAHMVGFDKNLESMVHIHPSGASPAGEGDRGGPVLNFQLTPQQPGMHKLFLQVKNRGQVITAPFIVGVDGK